MGIVADPVCIAKVAWKCSKISVCRERKERIKSQSGSGRGRTTQKLPARYSILLFHGEPPSFSRLLNKLGACHSERSEESAFANFPRITRFLVACGSSE